MELAGRQKAVLRAVVELYIESGETVSSTAVAKRCRDLKASPATIRHVMAELTERGLLHQPHTSAGRQPTEAGLRIYVDTVMSPKLHPWDRTRLQAAIQGEVLPEKLSQGVAGLAGQLTVVAVPNFLGTRFKEIGLMRIDRGRFAAFFVALTGVVEQSLVEVDFDLSQQELQQIQNFLNENLKDRLLEDVRNEIVKTLELEQNEADDLRRQAFTIGDQAIPEAEIKLYVEGQSHLVDHPDASDSEKLRGLIRTIEEKSAILALLDRILDGPGVKVLLGSDHAVREMLNLTAVGSSVPGSRAAVTVLGPTRMDYGRLVPMVDFASTLLARAYKD